MEIKQNIEELSDNLCTLLDIRSQYKRLSKLETSRKEKILSNYNQRIKEVREEIRKLKK